MNNLVLVFILSLTFEVNSKPIEEKIAFWDINRCKYFGSHYESYTCYPKYVDPTKVKIYR